MLDERDHLADHLSALYSVTLDEVQGNDAPCDAAGDVDLGRLDYSNHVDLAGIDRRPQVVVTEPVKTVSEPSQERQRDEAANDFTNHGRATLR